MPYGRHTSGGGYAASGELEREVECADALVRKVLGSLPRGRADDHEICRSASVALGRLRPHLEGTLAALALLEEIRDLTEKELSFRCAFGMLCRTKD